MYLLNTAWKRMSGLILAAILIGCSPAPTVLPTATLQPTVDTGPTLAAIATQAVQTAMANLTLTAPSATPVPPTSTTAPTNTPAPTDTPGPTNTPTHVFIPWTKTPTATQAAFACTITSVSPASSDTIKTSQDFDGKWIITNTGSKAWSSSNVDAHYVSGTKFQKKADVVDLTSDVAPNSSYSVIIDMTAPSSEGTYSTVWGLTLEDGSVCTLNMTINVSK